MNSDERRAVLDKLELAQYHHSPSVTLSLDEVSGLLALLNEQKRGQVSVDMLLSFADELEADEREAVRFARNFMRSVARDIRESDKSVLVDVDAIGRMYLYLEARGYASPDDNSNEPGMT